TDSELTESDDGYGSSNHHSRDAYTAASQRPRSPPRSVPARMDSSHSGGKMTLPNYPHTKWKRAGDNATPPQSKPPSLLELPPSSPIQLSFTMPPTPPPKSGFTPGDTP